MTSPQTQPLPLSDFRQAFPEINEDEYPDGVVLIRLKLADKFFSPRLWQDSEVRKHVMGLYAAHYLTVVGKAAAGGSGQGGAQLGVVSSKSVDGASVSYDTTTASENGAGFWNATAYGRELWQLLRVFGAGAVQL